MSVETLARVWGQRLARVGEETHARGALIPTGRSLAIRLGVGGNPLVDCEVTASWRAF